MTIKWGGEKGVAEWQKRREEFLDQAPKAKELLEYSSFVGPFDMEAEDKRRQFAVDSLLVGAKFGNTDNKLGRQRAYMETIFPMDYKEDQNQKAAIAGCPGASSCGTFIRGTWQLLGAGDWTIFNDPAKKDRGLRGSYNSNKVMAQIAAWAHDCGALHGSYKDPDDNTIKGPAVGLDDPNLWKPGDVVFLWQQFDKPASDGTTGKHHIFTVTEVPTSKGTGKWEVKSVDGGSATHGTDGPCMGISNNSRVVENTTNKLVVKVGKMWGDGVVTYWVDFAKVRFTDPTYLIREPGPKYPGPNDSWP